MITKVAGGDTNIQTRQLDTDGMHERIRVRILPLGGSCGDFCMI